ncbi:MAG: pyridoxal-dependent decarboxylase, partial [Clostridiales bacterium]|nr:pyridoxal-dependent decarboxylase [Clostridiales bacterium]
MEFDGKLLSELSEQFGDSFYILDIGKFIYNYKRLKSAFSSFYGNSYIAYSYKTNYIPILCRKAAELGAYAEVVSEMEYELAKRVGTEAKKIILNGPVKSRRAVEELLI